LEYFLLAVLCGWPGDLIEEADLCRGHEANGWRTSASGKSLLYRTVAEVAGEEEIEELLAELASL
jgi:hypothetical protein